MVVIHWSSLLLYPTFVTPLTYPKSHMPHSRGHLTKPTFSCCRSPLPLETLKSRDLLVWQVRLYLRHLLYVEEVNPVSSFIKYLLPEKGRSVPMCPLNLSSLSNQKGKEAKFRESQRGLRQRQKWGADSDTKSLRA